ncbi:MAG TPA: hypothetical protein VK524_02540, partial [Polyangiaceae bacterium]|nr:hypothetical protein [Polyangiaceae bacterium]
SRCSVIMKTCAVSSRSSRLVRASAFGLVCLWLPRCGGYDGEGWGPEGNGGAPDRDASSAGRASAGREGGVSGASGGGPAHAAGRDAGIEAGSAAGAAGTAGAGGTGAPLADAGQSPSDAGAGERSAVVRINEINANIAKGCDAVELYVIRAGNLHGIELWARTTAVLTFGALSVEANDVIVVHLNAESCCPDFESEATSKTQSSAPGTYRTAYDWYSTSAGLVSTDLVLTLYDARGNILDAALFADDVTGTSAALSEQQAEGVAATGHWTTVAGGVPASGFVDDTFSAHSAQDLNATGTTPDGESIARIDDEDRNSRADWAQGPSSWGRPNTGQTVQ